MTTREVIRRGSGGDVPFHEHDATDISGKFDFLRVLQAIIDGDITVTGYVRTEAGANGQYIEIRPETGDPLVPSLQFFTGQSFSSSEPFIEVEDQGSGVWALKLIGPVGTTATDEALVRLHSDGRVELAAASHVPVVVGGSEIVRADAGGLVLIVDGTAANPAIARSATEDGVFFASGVVGLAVGGSEVGRFTSAGLTSVAEGAVTAHEAALSVTESQITDLAHVPDAGYTYGSSVYFTASDTFAKGDYPGLRAIKARVQGGGGGGGAGTNDTAGLGSGGAGGGYAEAFVLVADLATTEAVTVGAGGAGGTTGDGSAGADSVLDTISGEVRGEGGALGTANGSGGFSSGGNGTGDLVIRGGTGGRGGTSAGLGLFAGGGDSHMGHGGRHSVPGSTGTPGVGYGSGGAGGHSSNPTDRAGGDGADGIVIVDLYY